MPTCAPYINPPDFRSVSPGLDPVGPSPTCCCCSSDRDEGWALSRDVITCCTAHRIKTSCWEPCSELLHPLPSSSDRDTQPGALRGATPPAAKFCRITIHLLKLSSLRFGTRIRLIIQCRAVCESTTSIDFVQEISSSLDFHQYSSCLPIHRFCTRDFIFIGLSSILIVFIVFADSSILYKRFHLHWTFINTHRVHRVCRFIDFCVKRKIKYLYLKFSSVVHFVSVYTTLSLHIN